MLVVNLTIYTMSVTTFLQKASKEKKDESMVKRESIHSIPFPKRAQENPKANSVIVKSLSPLERRTTLSSRDYNALYDIPNQAPFDEMAPHLNVVWSRGWYNAVRLPQSVPQSYYNSRGRMDRPFGISLLRTYYTPTSVCETGYVWINGNDLSWFAREVLHNIECEISIITSDCDNDVPNQYDVASLVLGSSKIKTWYAQDKTAEHEKLVAIPIGVPIHYGFEGSPHSVSTVQAMMDVRKKMPDWSQRKNGIILNIGTIEGGSYRRTKLRIEANDALSQCSPSGILVDMPKSRPPLFWEHFSQYRFGVAVSGVGWDTFRLWEMFFFGVVPIVKRSPLTEFLLEPAHLPVVIVDNWSEVCDFTGAKYEELIKKYEGWIDNAHRWLEPALWIPRNQSAMDELCDAAPGCTR